MTPLPFPFIKLHSLPSAYLSTHKLVTHCPFWDLLPPTPTYSNTKFFQGSQGPCLLYSEPWLAPNMSWGNWHQLCQRQQSAGEAELRWSWSGWPVSCCLDRDPRLLSNPFSLFLPVWQEPTFNLREHCSTSELSWQTLDELFTLFLLSECRCLCDASSSGYV